MSLCCKLCVWDAVKDRYQGDVAIRVMSGRRRRRRPSGVAPEQAGTGSGHANGGLVGEGLKQAQSTSELGTILKKVL